MCVAWSDGQRDRYYVSAFDRSDTADRRYYYQLKISGCGVLRHSLENGNLVGFAADETEKAPRRTAG